MTKHKFRSGFERKLFEEAIKNRRSLEYEPKDAKLSYTRVQNYQPDYRLPNGVLVEAKGRFTGSDRTKMLRVRKENPGVDIRLVFQRPNNKLTKAKNSKQYWEWAEQHGFKWAAGSIPEEWFYE